MKNAIIALLILSILTATTVAAFDPGFGAGIDVNTKTDVNKISITGTTFGMPEGTNVQLWCSGRSVGETPIDSNGAFVINTVYGGINGCNPGIATLKAGAAETNVTIPPQYVYQPGGGSGGEDITTSIHAPEFSLLTLGLAVIGVGLGLAVLRKR